MHTQSNNPGRILRLPEVIERTGIKRSSIYARMQEGTFPQRIKLGPRCVGWLEDGINEWIAQQILNSELAGGIHE